MYSTKEVSTNLGYFETMTKWEMEDVRAFCIRHNYYNAGDVEAYDKMLKKVETLKPTDRNIVNICIDIWKHTAEYTELVDLIREMYEEVIKTYRYFK